MKNKKIFLSILILTSSKISVCLDNNKLSTTTSSTTGSITQTITITNTETIKGSGVEATKEIECSGIDTINISGIGVLNITQDKNAKEQLVISADDNILPFINAQANGQNLELSVKNDKPLDVMLPITYNITLKNVVKLVSSGTAVTKISNIDTDSLSVVSSGSSLISGNIKATTLNVTAKDVTKVTLSGEVNTQNITVSQSGVFDGQKLLGKKATVNASGASKIQTNVSDEIFGSVSGASKLLYTGTPVNNVKVTFPATMKQEK